MPPLRGDPDLRPDAESGFQESREASRASGRYHTADAVQADLSGLLDKVHVRIKTTAAA